MRILFIRHTEAEEAGHGVPGLDADRRLTRKGRRDARLVGQTLEFLRVRPRLVLSSPYARAMETAEQVVAGIKRAPGIIPVKALEPGASWGDLRAELARHGDRLAGQKLDSTWVFAVGHQPNLGEMVIAALGGRGDLTLKKGAVVGLGWGDDKPEGPAAEICVVLNPDSIRRIAGSHAEV